MSDDSDKEAYSDGTASDEDESDEDEENFLKRVHEDLRRCALLTAGPICDPYLPQTTQILLEYQLGRWVPRLREPRDLYGVSSSGPLSPTRWPYHCEVIDERVQHIDWTPFPEPVYTPTGLELEPFYPNAKDGVVVYLAEDASPLSEKGASVPCPMLLAPEPPQTQMPLPPGTLTSSWAEHEYQLTLRPDLFTNKHTQWYYFQVTNTQAGVAYRFTIVNFTKPTSLYNRGMRPLFYSEKDAEAHRVGWKRIGDQIKYYKNHPEPDGRHYFSLTWTFQFPHSQDTCYFAHCYPYTYSNLQEYLSGVHSDPVRSKFCKIRVLCHTLARNMVYVLTITTPWKSSAEPHQRKAVVLTARVHPGETNSSWIMKGFLDYLLGASRDAQLLRDMFIFKVVPMLNPDGVVVGNYRCSLAGRDLNRSYRSVLKESCPSVWYTRNMIRRLMEKREVILYCDLHGHSRKENIFMYGCDGSNRSKAQYLQQRIFPLMLSKNCPDKFSFPACKFNVQKSKEGTGRVVMWRMGIRNSFTMEATFCGSTLGYKRGTHFNTKDLESMGYHFCDSLLDYCDPDRTKYFQCLKELEEMEKHMNLEKIIDDSDTSLLEISMDLESSSRGSDTSESNDSQSYVLKLTPQLKPKKYLKTKKERNSTIAGYKHARDGHKRIREQRAHLSTRRVRSSSSPSPRWTTFEDKLFLWATEPTPKHGPTGLRHHLTRNPKRCTSFQSKKAGVNLTDDEKRIYRDKKLSQTQEMLQYLLPIIEITKSKQISQMNQIFNPRANLQTHRHVNTAACLKRNRSSSMPSRNPLFLAQRDLLKANPSEWLQCVPLKSFESLSPLKDTKNRKKYSGVWAIKTDYQKPSNNKWETRSTSGEMDANITKAQSLQAKESSPKSLAHVATYLTEHKKDQPPNKNNGQPTFHLKYRRSN
ncbi:cytosolic carboxypeptidase 3 [Echinops telfairi]|uniref:Cytosolic carboxypeptidase 3 n=1 Tax=Echinops telfairi TaxID=9371 RepID=A0ABM0IUC8_ECHTE|nr:cytosolic carboxypeptidase 3 [Echinops telfairi]